MLTARLLTVSGGGGRLHPSATPIFIPLFTPFCIPFHIHPPGCTPCPIALCAPPVNGMTDRCKNISFPQLRLRAVKIRQVCRAGNALRFITCFSLLSALDNMSHNTPDLSIAPSFFSITGLTPSARDTSPDLLLFRRLLGEHPKGLLLFLFKCPIAVFSVRLFFRFSFVLCVLLRMGFFLFLITITSDGRFHFGELSDIWSVNTTVLLLTGIKIIDNSLLEPVFITDREAKPMFLLVCLSTGRRCVSQHALGQGVCIPACTLTGECGQDVCRRGGGPAVYTPPPETATDAVSTHPTGILVETEVFNIDCEWQERKLSLSR